MPITTTTAEDDIDKILHDLEKCREQRCPAKVHLKRLINLGFDFSEYSLRGMLVDRTNFSEAKGLTIDNWLSAAWASHTKLPPNFDFTHYENLKRVGDIFGIICTDFSLVKGLNPNKPKTLNYNKGLPKELKFPHGWFAGRELLAWDFSNTEDVTSKELSFAKRLENCTLPRGVDLVKIRRFHTQIQQCYAIDPILPKIGENDDILDGITVRFSSFSAFLKAGSLDTLHTLIEMGAKVKGRGGWLSVNDYIRKFVQSDLAKGLFSEEESNKAKALALGIV